MAKVTMPQLGESVAEGTIGKWLKQPGDHVAKYEPLLEVITDKVNAEVPSPFEGTLVEILVEEGATVPNNAEIAVIAEAGASAEAGAVGATEVGTGAMPAPAAAPAATVAHGPAGSDERPEGHEPATAAPLATAAPPPPGAPASPVATVPFAGDPDARMTPAVRRLLREHDLQPGQVVGTGGGGRITRDDVLALVEATRTSRATPAATAATTSAATTSAATGMTAAS
ncbi:MAG: biotin/lipoyl-containing protein, partial [Candidatus Limnocylindrales bacterium]